MNGNSWSMSDERQFMENLFCQRFNFFLVVFSLVVAGAASTSSHRKQTAILALGFFLCVLLALTVYRNYVKLIAILKRLHNEKDHPVKLIGEDIDKIGAKGLFGVNHLIGILIPVLCCLTLLGAAWLSYTGYLQ
jgi:hypothetical protein